MPTPPKPHTVLKMEKKSHRTKAELALREKGEQSLSSGEKIEPRDEVKQDPVALAEFNRVKGLLEIIEKDDAIYQNVINRYAKIISECVVLESSRESFAKDLMELTEEKDKLVKGSKKMPLEAYYKLKSDLQKNVLEVDKQIQSKRKMLLEIEKENVMTIASALRSIPKNVDSDKPESKFAKFGALSG